MPIDTPQSPNMPQTGPGAGYPDASVMPEINGQADAQAKAIAQGSPNPIITSLSTIGDFIKKTAGGDQNSPLIIIFKALIEEIQKVAGGGTGGSSPPVPGKPNVPGAGAPPAGAGAPPAGAGAPPAGAGAPNAPQNGPMNRTIGNFAGGSGGQQINAAPGAKLFV